MRHRFVMTSFFAGLVLLFPHFIASDETQKVLPAEAFKRLMSGNERYVNDKLLHPNRTSVRREAVSSSQAPFAIILGCSDSRVAPEIIFDQGIGDLFVVRVAGNVVGPIELASIEFSAIYLDSAIIFVMGHENCGAVKAVLANQTKDIEPIAAKIKAALEDRETLAENPLENAIKANVRGVVKQLRANEVLAKLIAEKRLQIVGGYYQLTTGKVEICCELP